MYEALLKTNYALIEKKIDLAKQIMLNFYQVLWEDFKQIRIFFFLILQQ